jgi:hypothetical protein
VAGLNVRPGERLQVVRRDVFMATMVVLRAPGEAYLLCHNIGPDTVSWLERVDPESLEVVKRSPDLPGGPFWPGGVAAHANGSLYVTYGRWCHRLGPDCEPIAARELPQPRPYNSLVILADGTLVMKDLIRDGAGPSRLTLLEPERLTPLGPEIEMPEASIARLSADGDTLYVIGDHSAFRYQWDRRAGRLTLDDTWCARYRTRPDQSYGWDVVLEGGYAWFMDNGDHNYDVTMRGKGVSSGPVQLIRVALDDARDVDMLTISGLPHGTVTNPPLFDPERHIAVAFDSGNDVLRAWRIHPGGHAEPHWRLPFGTASHFVRYPDTGEVVVNDFRADGTDDVVVLDLESGAEKARVSTGSQFQSVVFPSAGWGRDFYYCSFSTVARVSVV